MLIVIRNAIAAYKLCVQVKYSREHGWQDGVIEKYDKCTHMYKIKYADGECGELDLLLPQKDWKMIL